jgi:hypothetical protein
MLGPDNTIEGVSRILCRGIALDFGFSVTSSPIGHDLQNLI